ncbi:Transposase IS4 [Popillia japonica]|uniref:Transposase IS4 n=1 Tax=Popillia japonica TaxID=7064 RepID=A0AAW1K347_POPJA
MVEETNLYATQVLLDTEDIKAESRLHKRGFTLEEALQMVFSDDIDEIYIEPQEALQMVFSDDIDEIYIEPPDAAILTDEDSGEEDGGGVIDNLSGAQLRAPAEVILHNNERIGGDDQLLNAEDKIVVQNNSSQPLLVQLEKPNWCQGDLQPPNSNFQAGTYVQYKHLTPTQFFEKFIDDDVIQLLLEETSKYALFRNCADPKVSKEEMRCFIGVLVLSGYNELPSKRHYWDIDSDMRNELV